MMQQRKNIVKAGENDATKEKKVRPQPIHLRKRKSESIAHNYNKTNTIQNTTGEMLIKAKTIWKKKETKKTE